MIGSGGAGKSTLARELGERTGLPVVHLDRHFWSAGWIEPQPDAWERQVHALSAGERWISDGNYGRTMEIRLARADTIVFLDFPRWRCIPRVYRRWWRHRKSNRPDIAEGCPDRVSSEFLVWLWRFPRDTRPGILERIERYRNGRAIVVLRSPREVRRFLESASR